MYFYKQHESQFVNANFILFLDLFSFLLHRAGVQLLQEMLESRPDTVTHHTVTHLKGDLAVCMRLYGMTCLKQPFQHQETPEENTYSEEVCFYFMTSKGSAHGFQLEQFGTVLRPNNMMDVIVEEAAYLSQKKKHDRERKNLSRKYTVDMSAFKDPTLPGRLHFSKLL